MSFLLLNLQKSRLKQQTPLSLGKLRYIFIKIFSNYSLKSKAQQIHSSVTSVVANAIVKSKIVYFQQQTPLSLGKLRYILVRMIANFGSISNQKQKFDNQLFLLLSKTNPKQILKINPILTMLTFVGAVLILHLNLICPLFKHQSLII